MKYSRYRFIANPVPFHRKTGTVSSQKPQKVGTVSSQKPQKAGTISSQTMLEIDTVFS
jgi:hypothetical protein